MIGKTTSKTLIVELQNFILINISFKKIWKFHLCTSSSHWTFNKKITTKTIVSFIIFTIYWSFQLQIVNRTKNEIIQTNNKLMSLVFKANLCTFFGARLSRSCITNLPSSSSPYLANKPWNKSKRSWILW
jgi:hypothetical protein